MPEPPGSSALVLGIDASSRQGTVAVVRALAAQDSAAAGSPPHSWRQMETIEVVALADGQPSETLVPAISALLARHGIAKGSLSLLAVASGPGSFTGLRVSLATVKGLAEALQLPVVPVSVLEALALATLTLATVPESVAGQGQPDDSPGQPNQGQRNQGRAVTMLDAQRNEVYFGEFLLDRSAGLAQTLREEIAPVAECARWLAELAANEIVSPVIVTPEEAVLGRLREALASEGRAGRLPELSLCPRPTAEAIARIGWRKFLAGLAADAASLDANYLRRSEAELVSGPVSRLVSTPRLGLPPR